MGKKLKHLWHSRPRLSRVGKIIRNLLIITVALLAWWWEFCRFASSWPVNTA